MDPLSKYLTTYAERESAWGKLIAQDGPWDRAVVVPLLGEDAWDLLGALADAAQAATIRVLVILVLNAREDALPEFHDRNRALRERLQPLLHRSFDDSVSGGRWSENLDLCLIDRALPRHWFPPGQGVGLARKIGVDVAVSILSAGALKNPIVSTTDGDALPELDYFQWRPIGETCGLENEARCFLHPFAHDHVPGDPQSEALVLYEISLRYYVLGLRSAGSPYAFHTIGSTLSFDARAYAEARGFPRREAAEDFYLLNKLAKGGGVTRMEGGRIRLAFRPSTRVPFGTGRAMRDIADKTGCGETFALYHPRSFAYLRRWLEALEAFARHRDLERARSSLPNELWPLLDEMDAFSALGNAARTRPDAQGLRRHLHTWFDAFRTLKLIHAIRKQLAPSLPWRRALLHAPFFAGREDAVVATPQALRAALETEEKTVFLAANPS